MAEFDPKLHFEFKGAVYMRRQGRLPGGMPAHGVALPKFHTIQEGKLKRIHVNRHHIAANKKDGKNRPVYTIKHGGETIYARRLTINGPSECVADTNQLSCGARVWIETKAELHLQEAMTFDEAKAAFSDAVLD